MIRFSPFFFLSLFFLLFLISFFSGFFISLTARALGALGPLVFSLRTLEFNRRRDCDSLSDYRGWLVCWVVWAFFHSFESLADSFLCWLPMYNFVKFSGLIFCFLPQFNGAENVYLFLIRPIFHRHSNALEKSVKAGRRVRESAIRAISTGRNSSADLS